MVDDFQMVIIGREDQDGWYPIQYSYTRPPRTRYVGYGRYKFKPDLPKQLTIDWDKEYGRNSEGKWGKKQPDVWHIFNFYGQRYYADRTTRKGNVITYYDFKLETEVNII